MKNIRSREGLQGFLKSKRAEKWNEKWLLHTYFNMMLIVGWIPYEEFKKLPLPVLWMLEAEISEMSKRV